MIRDSAGAWAGTHGIPRESGDDPVVDSRVRTIAEYSPRERG